MKSITSILAILALAVTVNAADEKKPEEGAKKKANPEEAFKKLDKDANGSVTKEEWAASPQAKKDAAKAEKMFSGKDKNGDGSLSKEEFTAPGKKKKDA
ncbi:MAG TPA: EF-hand domain-containing protein [Prosthecobacter sp.]